MPSSISSSERRTARHWWWVAGLATCLPLIAFVALEHHWRAKGHLPSVVDSQNLWSLSRSQASGKDALIFLGASRTLYGIDLDAVRTEAPDFRPTMLALNGRYPLATLEALAMDDSVTGTVIVDVDARGLAIYNHEAQAAHNRYYETEWSPSKRVHRWLLNPMQASLVSLNPRFGLLPLVKNKMGFGPPPYVSHEKLDGQRSGSLDFTRVSGKALADSFAVNVTEDLAEHPAPSPADWLASLSEVKRWVDAIEDRGGRVIFYVPPVSARQRDLVLAAYPLDRYWRRFIEINALEGVHFLDFPQLQRFDLPDESHIDARDKADYTRTLMTILRSLNYL